MEKVLKALVLFALFLGLKFISTVRSEYAVAFTISSEKKSWEAANQTCRNAGGSLAVLDTTNKLSQLLLNNKLQKGEYWIGLKKQGDAYKWVDGTSLSNDIAKIIKHLNKKDCILYKKTSSDYKLKAKKCRDEKKFVCQNTTASISQRNKTSKEKNKKLIDDFHAFMGTLDVNDPDSIENLFENFDELMVDLDPNEITEDDFNLLMEANAIENFAMEYTKMHLNSTQHSLTKDSEGIGMHAEMAHRGKNSSVKIITGSKDVITLPKELFQEKEVMMLVIVFKNHKNATLGTLTPKTFGGKHNTVWLNTEIISLSTHPKLKAPFQERIEIDFEHIIQEKESNGEYCSFWNYSIPTSINGSWSDRGCRVKSSNGRHTVCECNHMTNFAVLMQLKPEKLNQKHRIALVAITYVGLVLSFIGEAITVLCYCLFLNFRNEKIQIRINLLCTLAAAQFVMMSGITETQNKGACVFVASLIHYFYLVSFCWMLMEGVHLYRLVVTVFDAGLKMRFAYLFSYGCPAPFVLIALFLAEYDKGGVFNYTSQDYCWLNSQNRLIWSFVAPVLIIVTINSVLLFFVIKEMFSMKTLKNASSIELSMIRASIRACVVLLPLLGITWMFGLLSLADIGITWQYIFTILNATQGFMIFLFHCVRNTELRTAITLRFHQWESNHSSHHSKGRVTPTKLNKETKSSDESPRNSVPMATPIANKVMPKNTI